MIKRFITSVWAALIGCTDRGEILPEEPPTFEEYVGKATSCVEMMSLAYEWKALYDPKSQLSTERFTELVKRGTNVVRYRGGSR